MKLNERIIEGDAPKLDVLLVHEDGSTGWRAERLLEQIAMNLKAKADFRVNLWSFDLLCHPALQGRAVLDAIRAHLVLLSANGCTELPATVRAVLEEWLDRRDESPCALVVSLDPASGLQLRYWTMCRRSPGKLASRYFRISTRPLESRGIKPSMCLRNLPYVQVIGFHVSILSFAFRNYHRIFPAQVP